MTDVFNNPVTMMQDPIGNAYEVEPHATDDLPIITRAIYIGGAGDLTCRLYKDAEDVTFSSLPAGSLLPLRVASVRDTSTTTLMLALY